MDFDISETSTPVHSEELLGEVRRYLVSSEMFGNWPCLSNLPSLAPSTVPNAFSSTALQIFRDQTVLETTLEVLSIHRNVRITNTLLHVILELDFGTALYFVTKAIQREVKLAGTSLLERAWASLLKFLNCVLFSGLVPDPSSLSPTSCCAL